MNAVRSRARLLLHLGLLLTLVGGLGVSSYSTAPAVASPTTSSLSVYLDAPFVQGSYVAQAGGSDPNVLSMSFNGTTGAGQCGTGAPAGISITGACQVYTAQSHGGATPLVTVSDPTVGGIGSNFPSTNHASNPIVISLTNESRYLGLWWPSGSDDNRLDFYNGATPLLTVTTTNIMGLLGTAPANDAAWVTQSDRTVDANVITAIDNTRHPKSWYFGNPRGYASTSPTEWASNAWTRTQPFVYIHMFAGGNLTFNKVELSGSGFEFDNLAVSTTAQTPNPRLVLASTFVSQHTVSFEPNGSDVQGAMADQVRSTTGPLRTNTFERPGFTFAGWATEAGGGGTRYADGAIYDLDADVTLHAQWTANSQPSSGGGGAPAAAAATGPSLAATGASGGLLPGLSALALILGLSLVARSRRLRNTAA